MIIQVNDAFGVGKTQTCNELHRRIQNSFFFDAENAGYFIRDNLPEEIVKDDLILGQLNKLIDVLMGLKAIYINIRQIQII